MHHIKVTLNLFHLQIDDILHTGIIDNDSKIKDNLNQ